MSGKRIIGKNNAVAGIEPKVKNTRTSQINMLTKTGIRNEITQTHASASNGKTTFFT